MSALRRPGILSSCYIANLNTSHCPFTNLIKGLLVSRVDDFHPIYILVVLRHTKCPLKAYNMYTQSPLLSECFILNSSWIFSMLRALHTSEGGESIKLFSSILYSIFHMNWKHHDYFLERISVHCSTRPCSHFSGCFLSFYGYCFFPKPFLIRTINLNSEC